MLDRKGRIVHDGGVTAAPGLYLIGMPFMRRRKSSLIDGAGPDAAELTDTPGVPPPRGGRPRPLADRSVLDRRP